MPWGFALELHAWWHIFTGIGSYILIVWGQYLRTIMDGREQYYVLVWPHCFKLPSVDLKTKVEAKRRKGATIIPIGKNGEASEMNGYSG